MYKCKFCKLTNHCHNSKIGITHFVMHMNVFTSYNTSTVQAIKLTLHSIIELIHFIAF